MNIALLFLGFRDQSENRSAFCKTAQVPFIVKALLGKQGVFY